MVPLRILRQRELKVLTNVELHNLWNLKFLEINASWYPLDGDSMNLFTARLLVIYVDV
jgi:hypothetical protein